jgi:DNA helicase HerA-like ATPase
MLSYILFRGKLVALDEAHKFMSTSTSSHSDGLSNAIVDTVRLMRHEGIRVAISTQNPMVLAPELLELVTVAVIHRFHSSDWFSYLSKKIPLVSDGESEEDMKSSIRGLQPGRAFIFGVYNSIEGLSKSSSVMQVSIRPRLTADRGATRVS